MEPETLALGDAVDEGAESGQCHIEDARDDDGKHPTLSAVVVDVAAVAAVVPPWMPP